MERFGPADPRRHRPDAGNRGVWRTSASLLCGSGQQESIGGHDVDRAKEAKTLDEFADEGVNRDHPFGLQFAQRHMNGPLIRASGAKAIAGKVSTLTDANASVPNQQEGIRAQIIAA